MGQAFLEKYAVLRILISYSHCFTRSPRADLSSTDLRGADFSDATLERVKLFNAKFDDYTKWPDGFDLSIYKLKHESDESSDIE